MRIIRQQKPECFDCFKITTAIPWKRINNGRLCFSMGWLEGGGVEDTPCLRHVVGAECCENKVPFFGMLYLRHIAGTGDFP